MKSQRPAGTTSKLKGGKKTNERSEKRGRVKTRRRSRALQNIVGRVLCTAEFVSFTEELTSGNSDVLKVKLHTFAAEVRACFFAFHVLVVIISVKMSLDLIFEYKHCCNFQQVKKN